MAKTKPNEIAVADDAVVSKIYTVRKQKVIRRRSDVMLDRDLAELFRVHTKALKQAVRRNADGFQRILWLTSMTANLKF